ncbi:hypothetical protein [Streptomyces sp. CA-132043]
MPYLPNDGTAPHAPYLRAEVVDLDATNVTDCRNQYWLIDTGDL